MRKTILKLALPVVLCAAPAMHAQIAAAGVAGAAAVAPHLAAAAPALLTSAVSAGSAHVGQAVLAKLASPSILSNGAKLPAGTQLLGKITQAVPASKGNGKSSLGMVFDRFKGADGQEQALSPSIIQSLGSGRAQRTRGQASADANASANAQADASANTGSGGGLLGGVVGGVGNAVSGVGNAVTGLVGTVTSLPGVLLDSTGTLVSQGKNVSVPAGTQITVAANADASAQ